MSSNGDVLWFLPQAVRQRILSVSNLQRLAAPPTWSPSQSPALPTAGPHTHDPFCLLLRN
ncbi:hypothetical protein BDV18DRAFT_118698 [Aspergillus unguis]